MHTPIHIKSTQIFGISYASFRLPECYLLTVEFPWKQWKYGPAFGMKMSTLKLPQAWSTEISALCAWIRHQASTRDLQNLRGRVGRQAAEDPLTDALGSAAVVGVQHCQGPQGFVVSDYEALTKVAAQLVFGEGTLEGRWARTKKKTADTHLGFPGTNVEHQCFQGFEIQKRLKFMLYSDSTGLWLGIFFNIFQDAYEWGEGSIVQFFQEELPT